ncbi:hypothetical protein ACFL2D_02985 [Patescibacteria group bacterium]
MELVREPETELEYWEAIDGFISSSFGLGLKIQLKEMSDEDWADQELSRMATTIERLMTEASTKFDFVPLKDCMPAEFGGEIPVIPHGKKSYWTWHHDMKRKWCEDMYSHLICSACPFSLGVTRLVMFRTTPCAYLQVGEMSRPRHNSECGLFGKSRTPKELYQEILDAHGVEALRTFIKKYHELGAGRRRKMYSSRKRAEVIARIVQ